MTKMSQIFIMKIHLIFPDFSPNKSAKNRDGHPVLTSKKLLSWNYIIKQLLNIALISLFIVDLYDKLNQSINMNGSDLLYYSMNISTIIISMLVLTMEWLKQVHTSLVFRYTGYPDVDCEK